MSQKLFLTDNLRLWRISEPDTTNIYSTRKISLMMIISPPTKAFCYIKMIELNIIETWKMWRLGSARAQEKCNLFFFFNRNSALALVENILTEYLSSFTRCSLQWLPTCTVTSEIIQTIFWVKLAFPVCIVNKLQVTSDEIGQHFVTHHLILPWHQRTID